MRKRDVLLGYQSNGYTIADGAVQKVGYLIGWHVPSAFLKAKSRSMTRSGHARAKRSAPFSKCGNVIGVVLHEGLQLRHELRVLLQVSDRRIGCQSYKARLERMEGLGDVRVCANNERQRLQSPYAGRKPLRKLRLGVNEGT